MEDLAKVRTKIKKHLSIHFETFLDVTETVERLIDIFDDCTKVSWTVLLLIVHTKLFCNISNINQHWSRFHVSSAWNSTWSGFLTWRNFTWTVWCSTFPSWRCFPGSALGSSSCVFSCTPRPPWARGQTTKRNTSRYAIEASQLPDVFLNYIRLCFLCRKSAISWAPTIWTNPSCWLTRPSSPSGRPCSPLFSRPPVWPITLNSSQVVSSGGRKNLWPFETLPRLRVNFCHCHENRQRASITLLLPSYL